MSTFALKGEKELLSIFYVDQSQTYKEERAGGCVWAPKLNKRGWKNAGYTRMTEIRKGDYILHSVKRKIMAISIVESDCYESNQPQELVAARTKVKWNDDGYRVDVYYYDFDTPLNIKEHSEWLSEHHVDGSAFDINGEGKRQYMCNLAKEHAAFILEIAIKKQSDARVIRILEDALKTIGD